MGYKGYMPSGYRREPTSVSVSSSHTLDRIELKHGLRPYSFRIVVGITLTRGHYTFGGPKRTMGFPNLVDSIAGSTTGTPIP